MAANVTLQKSLNIMKIIFLDYLKVLSHFKINIDHIVIYMHTVVQKYILLKKRKRNKKWIKFVINFSFSVKPFQIVLLVSKPKANWNLLTIVTNNFRNQPSVFKIKQDFFFVQNDDDVTRLQMSQGFKIPKCFPRFVFSNLLAS